jgi:hypothetical protein
MLLRAGLETSLVDALRRASAQAKQDRAPLDVVRRELPRLVSRFESRESIAIEMQMRSNMRSTEGLRARKQSAFRRLEDEVFESLRSVRSDGDETVLRVVAMVSIVVIRRVRDTWWEDRTLEPVPGTCMAAAG